MDYIKQLESWACEDVELCSDQISFTYDGYSYVIDKENVENTLTKTLDSSDLISCCGRVVDRDIMRCPKCYESQ